MIVIWAGLIAGAVHVFSGPDHLLALAPFSMQSTQPKVWIGLKWGLGHGVGIAIVAIGLLLLKAQIDVTQLSQWAEALVGVVLIAIGIRALFTAKQLVIHKHLHVHDVAKQSHHHSHLHLHVGETTHPHESPHKKHLHAPMWIGLLHGIAGTGHLFGLVPALGLDPVDAVVYLCAYVIASIATMMIYVMCLDVVVARAGKQLMPRFIRITGYAAILTGIFWLYDVGYGDTNLFNLGS